MKLRSALLAATIMAAPLVAKAETVDGVYIAAGAGGNFMQNLSVDHLRFPQNAALNNNSTRATMRYDANVVALGSVGYGFGNGVRVELEGNYRQNGLSGYGIGGDLFGSGFNRFPGTNTRGSEHKYGAMINAFYDFDLTPYGVSFVTPYVGVGIGYIHTENQGQNITGPGYRIRGNGTDDNLGYQGIVGAAFPLPDVLPGLALTLEYRFFGLGLQGSNNAQYFSAVAPGGTRVVEKTSENYNHSFLLGFRYAFNQAPPPPPPAPAPVVAPAPAPARTYLVFFDWDRADLTDRARQIIGEAAQASTRVQTTRIEVNGYTDKSGTASYNQRLSVRRAQAVAAELVRDGVARNAISIQGFGESNPLVPTADGVREPQNRRVEIILH